MKVYYSYMLLFIVIILTNKHRLSTIGRLNVGYEQTTPQSHITLTSPPAFDNYRIYFKTFSLKVWVKIDRKCVIYKHNEAVKVTSELMSLPVQCDV